MAELASQLQNLSDDSSEDGSQESILNGQCDRVSFQVEESQAEESENEESNEDSDDAMADSDASDDGEESSGEENGSPADIDPSSKDEASADEASEEGGEEEEEEEKDDEDDEDDDEAPAKQGEVPPNPADHQVVPVTKATGEQVAVMRNSTMATKLGMVGGKVRAGRVIEFMPGQIHQIV